MKYSGSLWVEREGEESAVGAELEIEEAIIRLFIGGGVVGEWPIQDTRVTEQERGQFLIAVEGDRLVFEAHDADGLRSGAAALLFRSRIRGEQKAESHTQSLSPASSPILAAQPGSILLSAGPQKSPGVAAVLSFFVPGVGQMYNGEIGKGIGIVFLQLFNFFVLSWFLGFGIIVAFFVWLWSIFDAYKVAESSNLSAAALANAQHQRAIDQVTGRDRSQEGVAVSIPLSLKSASPIKQTLNEALERTSAGSLTVQCNGRQSEIWFPRMVVETVAPKGISRVVFEGLIIGENAWRDVQPVASKLGVSVEMA